MKAWACLRDGLPAVVQICVSPADVVKSPVSPDPRDPAERPLGKAARTIYIPDLRLGSGVISGRPTEGIKVKPGDSR